MGTPEQIAVSDEGGRSSPVLQEFLLYETPSEFFMFGSDKCKKKWKVFRIDKLDKSKLCVTEDSGTYSEMEFCAIKKRIDKCNESTGGLKFVTKCYGIIGFIKFLGPYYMLLITERKQIGMICGHAVYSIAKTDMIPLTSFSRSSNVDYPSNEKRSFVTFVQKCSCKIQEALPNSGSYQELLFSYSYYIMYSLQKNLSNYKSRLPVYETLFVWNEFLTRDIRNQLGNSTWTVAVVHGFFKQIFEKGVNDKGRVANDVESEQIVTEDAHQGFPVQVSSIVQHRGSIPLFWSQPSPMKLKPEIIVSNKDGSYEATKLHFENLGCRYGNPVVVLNLIKAREKKPRESILLAEFANAIAVVNKDFSHENHLKFLHWDLHQCSKVNAFSAFLHLEKVAENVLELTRYFYGEVLSSSCNNFHVDRLDEDMCSVTMDENNLGNCHTNDFSDLIKSHLVKTPVLQAGVLRTNCIDCLDRTNFAQFAFGLVALGHQLRRMGYLDAPTINVGSPLAFDMMDIYEAMGDSLSMQYGGSPAHNKLFAELRGEWKPATRSQEFMRSVKRYLSNLCTDPDKQKAIDILLGHFQPQPGKPSIWELGSDRHPDITRPSFSFAEERIRTSFKRSLSAGSIVSKGSSSLIDVLPSDTWRTPPLSHKNSVHTLMRSESGNSNFLDIDQVSSSVNSLEEEPLNERSVFEFPWSCTSSGEIKPENNLFCHMDSSLKEMETGIEAASGDILKASSSGLNRRHFFIELLLKLMA